MLDNFLESYIQKLYKNSNVNMSYEQQNLYSIEDYYVLLKPVVELLKKYSDDTIEELREKIYNLSGLDEKIKEFIFQKKMTPGIVLTYGTKDYRETIIVGNQEEVKVVDGKLVPSIKEMQFNTIFDLASITKLYTSLSILKLVQRGIIKLDDEVVKYAPEFKNLKGVKIFDLLAFRVPLKTDVRIDETNNYEETLNILQNVKIDELNPLSNPYTDMGAMVLKYVIEHVTSLSYYDFLNKEILTPLKMKDTLVQIPKYKLSRTASTTGAITILKNGEVFTDLNELGLPHDPKARIFLNQNNLSGHAGLFSTADDMTKLARGLMNEEILNSYYLSELVKNRTGKKIVVDDKERYIQYLGYLCYSKHPILNSSELFHGMSGKSFASVGFTGGQFTVDPLNELYCFLGTNRVHNRVIRNANPTMFLLLKQETEKNKTNLETRHLIDSSKFAWERDDYLIHPCLKLAIQYKMLEDFYKINKVKTNFVGEKQKNI